MSEIISVEVESDTTSGPTFNRVKRQSDRVDYA